jgi:hypothetical protein
VLVSLREAALVKQGGAMARLPRFVLGALPSSLAAQAEQTGASLLLIGLGILFFVTLAGIAY